jgi:antitoxin VapB
MEEAMPKVLNIKNEEAYRLASEIAEIRKISLTEAVLESLRAQREIEEVRRGDHDLVERLMAIADEVAKAPLLDTRSDEEILGYDDIGVPR